MSRDRALDQLKRSLDRLAEAADTHGLALELTNSDMRHPAMLLGEAGEIRAVLGALQVPFLGVQADLGHALAAAGRIGDAASWSARGAWAESFLTAVAPHLSALRLHELGPNGEAHRLPSEAGWSEEVLGKHPDWRALPMTLEARGASLDRLLDTAERLESLAPKPLLGPAR
ncbi:Xylose isomerase-like TIM barrel [compost metagenome]